MEIKILRSKENPFLRRKEVEIEIIHSGKATPKKEEVVQELAKRFSVNSSQVVIDYIFSKKGVASSLVKFKILEEKVKEAKPKSGSEKDGETQISTS